MKRVFFADARGARRVAKHMQVLFMVLNGTHLFERDALAVLVVLGASIIGGRDVVAFVAFPDSDEV